MNSIPNDREYNYHSHKQSYDYKQPPNLQLYLNCELKLTLPVHQKLHVDQRYSPEAAWQKADVNSILGGMEFNNHARI